MWSVKKSFLQDLNLVVLFYFDIMQSINVNPGLSFSARCSLAYPSIFTFQSVKMRSQANVQINATSTSIWMHVCTHIAELLTTTTRPTPWRPQATWHGRKRERKCYDCLKKEVLNSRCLLARCDDGDLLAAILLRPSTTNGIKATTHIHTIPIWLQETKKRPPRPRRSNTNQMQKLLIAQCTHMKKA